MTLLTLVVGENANNGKEFKAVCAKTGRKPMCCTIPVVSSLSDERISPDCLGWPCSALPGPCWRRVGAATRAVWILPTVNQTAAARRRNGRDKEAHIMAQHGLHNRYFRCRFYINQWHFYCVSTRHVVTALLQLRRSRQLPEPLHHVPVHIDCPLLFKRRLSSHPRHDVLQPASDKPKRWH